MGSLGKDVARELGAQLNIPVVYHEIIEHLADRMRLRKSHVIRLLDGMPACLSGSPPTRRVSRSSPPTRSSASPRAARER
jgi:hypothetical protein